MTRRRGPLGANHGPHARLLLSAMLARCPWLRDTDHVGAAVHRAICESV